MTRRATPSHARRGLNRSSAKIKRGRRAKAGALAVVGSLITGPAIAANLVLPDESTAASRLIAAAQSLAGINVADSGVNATDWAEGQNWRVDPATGLREVRLTWPRPDNEPTIIPFNLFDHAADFAGYEALEGMGERRIIVPGDSWETMIRVHNDGPTDGRLTARFGDEDATGNTTNLLENLNREIDPRFRDHAGYPGNTEGLAYDAAFDPAYDHLFVNNVRVSDLFSQVEADGSLIWPEVPLNFDGASEIVVPAGEYVDLPFDWSFFAVESDPFTGVPHNIGNLPDTLAQFMLYLSIEGELPGALLTVFTTVEGPGGVSFSPVFERQELATAAEFSGELIPLGAVPEGVEMVNWSGANLLAAQPVEPDQPYLVTTFFDNLDMYSPELAAAYALVSASSSPLVSGATVEREDMFGEIEVVNPASLGQIGALSCVLVDLEQPVIETAAGEFEWNVISGVDGWNPATGQFGYIAVPDGAHAVCEQRAQTAMLSVRKLVMDLVGDTLVQSTDPDLVANWVVNIWADELPGITWTYEFNNWGQTGGAQATVNADGTVHVTAFGLPEYIKVRPGAHYYVEVWAPEELAAHYTLITVDAIRTSVMPPQHRDSTEGNVARQVIEVAAAVSRNLTRVTPGPVPVSLAAGEVLDLTFVSAPTEAVERDLIIIERPVPLPPTVIRLTMTGTNIGIALGALALLGAGIWAIAKNRKTEKEVA